ncbi:MAG TPA: hypothetical protein VLT62_29180 [Candidatus Methylomirabilis sp.]|nr:hypothetical protein [Candidatus Methylomirabilis sp.]
MARGAEIIRIPRVRAVVLALASLVLIGLGVFFRRYRGADRTAMALSVLVGAGICLVTGLSWFQGRFGGEVMPRRRLWGIGAGCGALAGACTSGVGIVLLAARWALDQQSGPVADPFLPAFLRALRALGFEMSVALPAYVAVGAVLGGLCGLGVAEAISISAERRVPEEERDAPDGPEGIGLPGGRS